MPFCLAAQAFFFSCFTSADTFAVDDNDALVIGSYTLTGDVVAYVALRLNGCLNAVDRRSSVVEHEEHRLDSLVLSLFPCTECGECTVAVAFTAASLLANCFNSKTA